jgi:hypothetical protein
VNAATGPIVAPRELFRSDELLVRQVFGFGGDVCYVTFASYTDNRTLDRPGFGEEHFAGRGIDAIHVLSRDNRWYQHPELDQALRAVAAAVAGYARVIAYGSSMGGFAALHYGARCHATVGLALSPQFSVDPAKVPFDRRWAEDVARIAFRQDEVLPLPEQYVVYDPCDAHDRRHYELFAARSPTIGVPVPHAGHPVGSYLAETDMLRALVEDIEAGSFDAAGYARELRRRRRRSGNYFFVLAHRMPAHRPRLRIALARLAAETQADNPMYWSELGAALDAAGAFDEAWAVHRKALSMPHATMFQRHYLMLHHEARGAYGEALAVVDRLIAENPAVLWFPQERRRIRRKRRRLHALGRLAGKLGLDPLVERLLG